MPRKPRKGYFVKGQFVAEGSELDLELKRALKGGLEVSKTDLKRESAELQSLGEQLLDLRSDLSAALDLPDKLVDALRDARRISDFEGRRRQMQFIGKLMRQLEDDTLQAVRAALQTQRQGSAEETAALHLAERWREDMVADDAALNRWIAAHPDTDVQQLRALVRQARKDASAAAAAPAGQTPRHGRAWREIFQLIKEQLHG